MPGTQKQPERAENTAPLTPIVDQGLAALPDIRHGFFTRQGGVSTGIYASLNAGHGSRDAYGDVAENRRRIAAHLDAAHLVTVHQIHSPVTVATRAPFIQGAQPRADALVTDRPGLAIGALSADCGPVLLADPQAGIVGAAHSGWRGLAAGILQSVIARMESFGADRARITAVLGPTISVDAYEVGADFREAVLAANPAFEIHLMPGAKPGKWQFDLPAAILATLSQSGINTPRWIGACTYADSERFYSYRRATHIGEPDYGRLVAAIALEG